MVADSNGSDPISCVKKTSMTSSCNAANLADVSLGSGANVESIQLLVPPDAVLAGSDVTCTDQKVACLASAIDSLKAYSDRIRSSELVSTLAKLYKVDVSTTKEEMSLVCNSVALAFLNPDKADMRILSYYNDSGAECTIDSAIGDRFGPGRTAISSAKIQSTLKPSSVDLRLSDNQIVQVFYVNLLQGPDPTAHTALANGGNLPTDAVEVHHLLTPPRPRQLNRQLELEPQDVDDSLLSQLSVSNYEPPRRVALLFRF
jgi:hypothetical protein